jgi:hypothetical protein
MKIVVSYRGAPRIRGWETGALVAKAFRSLGHEVYDYGNIYQTQEKLSNGLTDFSNIDLWVYMEMNDADRQFTEVKAIKAAKKVSWTFDNSYYPDKLLFLNTYFNFDENFVANPLCLDYSDRTHYLPYAIDEHYHARDFSYNKKHAVGIVGTLRDDRLELAEKLRQSGIEVQCIDNVFREDYIDALASCHMIINQNPPAGAGLLNMRFFEAQAAGCILFTENRDFTPNNEAWIEEINLLDHPISLPGYPYRDMGHLVGLCNKYKGDWGQARMCHAAIMLNHTYKDRCERILDVCFSD